MARGASSDEIRHAYRDKARQLHPDRHLEADPAAREAAAVEMRRINEAWRVLGDPRRRRAYDASFEARPGTRSYADTTLGRTDFDDDDDDEVFADGSPAGAWHALRAVPWLFILGVLAAIFVFTAYATSGDDDASVTATTGQSGSRSTAAGEAVTLGDCVDLVGGTAMRVGCGQPNDGQVVLEPEGGGTCPSDTTRAVLSDRRVLCLAR